MGSDDQHMIDGKGSRRGSTEGGSQGSHYDPNDHRSTPGSNPQPQMPQGWVPPPKGRAPDTGNMMGKGTAQPAPHWVPPPQEQLPNFRAPGWNQYGQYNQQPQQTGNPQWVPNSGEQQARGGVQ
eukprot:10276926-Heterocapsa_arctica.AAC.1